MKRLIATSILLILLVVWPVRAQAPGQVRDDGDVRRLLLALDRQERYLAKRRHKTLRLGRRRVPATRVIKTIRELRKVVLTAHGTPKFAQTIAERFEVVRVSQKALFTAYHSPLLPAREQPDAQFNVPILGMPPDLVLRRGRVYRRANGELTSAPTRAQIMDGCYDARKLAVAWTNDAVELYYTQIQGSAVLIYPGNRRKTLLFAGTNGYGYVSMERELIRRVPASERPGGYFGIRDYLRRHPDQADRYFRLNPRYIFFRLSDQPPTGMAGLPLTAKRSIATDKRHYGAGLVGYVTYREPAADASGAVSHRLVHRIVCDADTGAAITGPNRVDIYFGEGSARELFAAGLKNEGTLSYLLIRE